MCKFFSLVSDGEGNIYYFNAKQRKEMIKKNRGVYIDSHSVIASDFKLNPDLVNKYEYNPLTKVFSVDEIHTKKDEEIVEKQVRDLNFKTIVPELIIKPIIHPFKDRNCTTVTKSDIAKLKKWDSVRDSVWASVGDSVWASVRASVWDSVGDSVWAYISSFFDVKYGYDFSSNNKLWESGFIPSFDGKAWRLHSGKNAKIVFEITEEELKNYKE